VRLLEPIVSAALAFAPGWTEERLVSAISDTGGDVAFTHANGRGLVAVSRFEQCSVTLGALRASAPPPATTLRENLLAGPDESGDGYAVVLDRRRCGGKTVDRVDLDADGRVRGRTPLPIRGHAEPVLLLDSGTLRWAERNRLRLLGPGAARAVTVARGEVADVATAADTDGRLLIAWASGREVRATTVSASGRVGATVRLGRSLGVTALAVAQQDRRAVVAWNTWDGLGAARARLYAAVRDGRRFRPAQLVDRAPQVEGGHEGFSPPLTPSLAVSADGRALLGWHRFRDFHHEPRLSAARPGHRFGTPRPLDARELGDVGFDRDGRRIVAWTTDQRVYVGRDGAREEVARPKFPYLLNVTVLDDGRLQASWLSGWDGEVVPQVSIVTSET
jgi:hypothetical protein